MTRQQQSLSSADLNKKVAFAALHHRDYRRYFLVNLFSTMGDNIEHVISYWLLFQKFHSPVLGGFAVISHWTPFLFSRSISARWQTAMIAEESFRHLSSSMRRCR
jgi:hypothetical protein